MTSQTEIHNPFQPFSPCGERAERPAPTGIAALRGDGIAVIGATLVTGAALLAVTPYAAAIGATLGLCVPFAIAGMIEAQLSKLESPGAQR